MIKQFVRKIFIGFFLVINQANATQHQPWLGNLYEFELQTNLLYQDYSKISSGPHLKKYHSNDTFLNLSLSNSLPSVGFEFEVTKAWTRVQKEKDIDHLKLTGRYVWMDDIAGDPLSVTAGLSFIYALPHALRDVSSFHHGRGESELFVSIGKEVPEETWWKSRWCGMFGLGIADRGSPWLRINLSYEKKLKFCHEVGIHVRTLWGLGQHRLHLDHFHGYGSVQHQSIDLGMQYTYLIEYFGHIRLEYSYRIHARNFPVDTHRIAMQILYTFGI